MIVSGAAVIYRRGWAICRCTFLFTQFFIYTILKQDGEAPLTTRISGQYQCPIPKEHVCFKTGSNQRSKQRVNSASGHALSAYPNTLYSANLRITYHIKKIRK